MFISLVQPCVPLILLFSVSLLPFTMVFVMVRLINNICLLQLSQHVPFVDLYPIMHLGDFVRTQ